MKKCSSSPPPRSSPPLNKVFLLISLWLPSVAFRQMANQMVLIDDLFILWPHKPHSLILYLFNSLTLCDCPRKLNVWRWSWPLHRPVQKGEDSGEGRRWRSVALQQQSVLELYEESAPWCAVTPWTLQNIRQTAWSLRRLLTLMN